MINDDEYSVTSNHMELGRHSVKKPSLLLKDGKIVQHPKGKFNYGLDLISIDLKIRNILSGKVFKIEEQDRNEKYPTGYGKRLIIKTDKMIEVDGKQYPLFVHYAHATGDSFNNLNVGDSLEPGQEIGKMGRTGKQGPNSRMGVHLDLNGYIMVDGKRVYVSPSEFLPKGGLARPQGFEEGGEVDKDVEKRKYFIEQLVKKGKLPSSVLKKHPKRVGAPKEDEERWVDAYQHMSLDEMKDFDKEGIVPNYKDGGPVPVEGIIGYMQKEQNEQDSNRAWALDYLKKKKLLHKDADMLPYKYNKAAKMFNRHNRRKNFKKRFEKLADKWGTGYQEGGEVEDVGYNFEDFGSGQDYIDDMSERDDFGYSYAETQRPGYMQRPPEVREDVEFEVEDVVNRPVEAPPVDTSLDDQRQNMRRAEAEEFQRQQEIEESKKKPNLIEESKAKVEEFQGPDAEMVRKSYSEIEANMDDVDPRTGKLSLEAKQYLAQIPKQTLMDYRNTYAADADKPKLNDLLVQQESILKKIDRADAIQVGKPQRRPVRKISELDFLKIKKYKDREELEKARTEAINQAMKQSQIDPKRLFKNRSTMDKVVGLIGRVAGLYGSVKHGGPDYYEQYLDKEIAKDIQAQKLDQEFAKRKLAAVNFKVAALAKRYALSSADVKDKENLLKVAQTYQMKGQKVLDKQIKEKKKMLDLATLNRRGINSDELAYLMAKYPKLKIQESLVTARDGKHYYIMGGKQAVKKIKDSLADTQDSIDGLRDLEGYVDKVGIWNQGWAPWSFLSRDRAEAEALRDRLVGKLRIEFFGPGVMTDNEREQAKKILGDPNAFWTTDEREKSKIRSLIMKLNYGMRQKLRRDGLTMLPLSPNERRVKQLLKRNNLGDNPKNRVKIVDSLIEAEKESVSNGQKPGQFWDMNEPLPI